MANNDHTVFEPTKRPIVPILRSLWIQVPRYLIHLADLTTRFARRLLMLPFRPGHIDIVPGRQLPPCHSILLELTVPNHNSKICRSRSSADNTQLSTDWCRHLCEVDVISRRRSVCHNKRRSHICRRSAWPALRPTHELKRIDVA